MKAKNLSLFLHNKEVPVDIIRFNAGESLVKIDSFFIDPYDVSVKGMITLDFKSNEDLIDLALLVDAIKQTTSRNDIKLSLRMSYMPYARNDRVMTLGEPHALKVIANFINSLNFYHVYCDDLHSDVSSALINNLIHKTQANCAKDIFYYGLKPSNTVLVSPDAGANKKVFEFAKTSDFAGVVRADKTRDIATGKLSGTVVYSEHIGNKDFLILDDILDAGVTFLQLAEKLRPLTTGKIYLYVTHGIFAKGIDIFHPLIDNIYCYNIMLNNWENKDSHSILINL